MTGYKIVNLQLLLNDPNMEASDINDLLASFSCPINRDVEYYLKHKAVEFSKHGWGRTHLVFASYRDNPVLVGYFTLANKYMKIKAKTLNAHSNSLRKRINAFATYDQETREYIMTAPLIGQLGKNYTDNYNLLISGDELLNIALDKIARFQIDMGGKFAYIECEDSPKLIEFYRRNGFVEFDRRPLDQDEKSTFNGECLIQMVRYIK